MGTLTIRNLEDTLKARLRLRAAAQNRSMEEEARLILRAALQGPVASDDLAARIRARFASFGDTQLPIPARQAVREPPELALPARKAATAKAVKRRR
jgi:plasmid stability protein